ncbi:MAG: NAD(P)-binding domain-containing protein [Prevotella sp.]|nr:NAD(P)-binding domain-containing protein [Prevotella sp.]
MKITVIGAGAMGGSTVEGMLKLQSLKAGDITVSDPMADLSRFAAAGARTTTDNAGAVKGADVVMVFVKPWLVEQVLKGIKATMDYANQTLVVIAAGVKGASILEWMDKDGTAPATLLCIPNIAIAQLASMTFLVNVNASDCQVAAVKVLFDELGKSILTTENLLGAGTTLASCGIAYAMRYVRASSEGGVELGFKAHDAQEIVMQTMKGAVELLQASGMHPEAAIDLVTTPGGVTIKGLNEMEHAGFTSAVIRGLKAGAK